MMTHPAPASDLQARARRVRLACFDVDGTLTDGRLTFDSDGRESKSFHVHDGQGLVLLRRAGIEVAFVTARVSVIAERRAAELGVRAFTGIGDKRACVEELARSLGIELADVAFMGDDLPDLDVMRGVGLSACPANAQSAILDCAAWHASSRGGEGAARELCDFILAAQGHPDTFTGMPATASRAALGAQA